MALAFYLRALVTLSGGTVAVRSAQEASGQPGWHAMVDYFYDRLTVDEEELAILSEDMAELSGYAWSLATYTEPFELRKVQFISSQQDAAVASDDSRVMTFHLAKISGSAVSDTWVAGDFTALDAAFTAWWESLKPLYSSWIVWDRIKVYKAGPAIVPPQPPVYDADKSVAGTNSTGIQLPPQVAISVTEIAGSKRFWGRFFLPAPAHTAMSGYGRVASATQTTIADATDTLYTALRSANLHPVVYRAPLPDRETRAGAPLAARAASAWTVEKIQVDDVADVIRRRRFKYPTLRVQRDI